MRKTAGSVCLEDIRKYLNGQSQAELLQQLINGSMVRREDDENITIADGMALDAVRKHIVGKFNGLSDGQRYLVGLLAAAAQSEGHQPSSEELGTALGRISGESTFEGLEAMIAAITTSAGFSIGTQGEQGPLALHPLEAEMIYAGLPENNPSQQPDRYRLHGALAMAILTHQVESVAPEVTIPLAHPWGFSALPTLWYLGDGKPRSESKKPESRGAVKLALDYLNKAWKVAFREGSRHSLELMKDYGERALHLIELARKPTADVDYGLAIY